MRGTAMMMAHQTSTLRWRPCESRGHVSTSRNQRFCPTATLCFHPLHLLCRSLCPLPTLSRHLARCGATWAKSVASVSERAVKSLTMARLVRTAGVRMTTLSTMTEAASTTTTMTKTTRSPTITPGSRWISCCARPRKRRRQRRRDKGKHWTEREMMLLPLIPRFQRHHESPLTNSLPRQEEANQISSQMQKTARYSTMSLAVAKRPRAVTHQSTPM